MPDSDSSTGPAATLEPASWGRRLLALLIDWFAVYAVVAYAAGGVDEIAGNGPANGWLLGVFVLECTVLVWLLGGSFGQLVTRIRVASLNGKRIDPLRSAIRAVLVALVIPPLVFKADGRGLHDMIAKTQVVRLA